MTLRKIVLWWYPNVAVTNKQNKDGSPGHKIVSRCPCCENDGYVTLDGLVDNQNVVVPCPHCVIGKMAELRQSWWTTLNSTEQDTIRFDGKKTIHHRICRDCSVAGSDRAMGIPGACSGCEARVAKKEWTE